MNQEKIGRFIAEQRKINNLTQRDLAEKLNITDRAVSKWENGRAMPDSGIMLDLCKELKISVNELLSGKRIEMGIYNEVAEKNLLEMKRQEESNKRMLKLEWVIGYIATTTFLILIFVASFVSMGNWLKVLLILFGIITFIIGICNSLKIEQSAGYYECNKCHYKYIPTYKNVLLARHLKRTRYMICPKCNRKSWNKKVLSK